MLGPTAADVLCHYAAHEVSALKRLTARHATRDGELDQLLRDQRFVDLYGVVRQGLRISKSSYSIKKMEAFDWGPDRRRQQRGQRRDGECRRVRTVAHRVRRLPRGDRALQGEDVRSTLAWHTWLEERGVELEKDHSAQPRRSADDAETPSAPGAAELAEEALGA